MKVKRYLLTKPQLLYFELFDKSHYNDVQVLEVRCTVDEDAGTITLTKVYSAFEYRDTNEWHVYIQDYVHEYSLDDHARLVDRSAIPVEKYEVPMAGSCSSRVFVRELDPIKVPRTNGVLY